MLEIVTAHRFDGLAILAIFRLLCFGFFGDQRYGRDPDFVVIRMYLIEREKAVPVTAVFDECRL